MRNQRRIERHQLPYYLKLFNRVTDQPMGYIGNLSRDGLLLISEIQVLVGARFEMRFKIPGRDGSLQCVDFAATCLWSREDVTPGSFNSGFTLLTAPPMYLELIESLRNYFSFRGLPESA